MSQNSEPKQGEENEIEIKTEAETEKEAETAAEAEEKAGTEVETAEEAETAAEPEEKPEADAGNEKQERLLKAGKKAEKLWKNKWYQRFITVLFVLVMGSGVFAYRYIEMQTSADGVIETYMQLFSAGNWQGMYEEADAEEAGIPYDVWETAISAGRTNYIESYTYKLNKTENGIQYYTVTYLEEESGEKQTLSVALEETGETLYHFFKVYQVSAAPLAINGATVTVPEGISFTFDSIDSEELDCTGEGENVVYELPPLLAGEYEVYLTGATVEDQAFTVTVGENARYFTWLDYDVNGEIAVLMEEHLSEIVLTILSEAVEYGEMERDYGVSIGETYGHDGVGDWNALGTAINDSLNLAIMEVRAASAEEEEDDAEDETEYLEITELSVDSAETVSYDFIYPDSCKVKLTLECGYTAGTSEIDILDPDADDSQTRTGTITMEFVAEYLVDEENWQISDCTYTSSYTMNEPEDTQIEEE